MCMYLFADLHTMSCVVYNIILPVDKYSLSYFVKKTTISQLSFIFHNKVKKIRQIAISKLCWFFIHSAYIFISKSLRQPHSVLTKQNDCTFTRSHSVCPWNI